MPRKKKAIEGIKSDVVKKVQGGYYQTKEYLDSIRPDLTKPVDFALVEKLGNIACLPDEVAYIVGVDLTNLRKVPDRWEKFTEAYQRGLSNAKMSLRRAQFIKAVNEGNPTMQIWLGKQLLGQRDKFDIDNTHEGTIEVKHALAGLTTEELRKLAGMDQPIQATVTEDTPKLTAGERLVVETYGSGAAEPD